MNSMLMLNSDNKEYLETIIREKMELEAEYIVLDYITGNIGSTDVTLFYNQTDVDSWDEKDVTIDIEDLSEDVLEQIKEKFIEDIDQEFGELSNDSPFYYGNPVYKEIEEKMDIALKDQTLLSDWFSIPAEDRQVLALSQELTEQVKQIYDRMVDNTFSQIKIKPIVDRNMEQIHEYCEDAAYEKYMDDRC